MSKEREHQPQDLTLDEVIRQARDVILEHGEHPAMLITTGTRQNVLGPLSEMAATHEGRVQQLFVAGLALGHTGSIGVLKQVFFICESWMSKAQDKKLPVMPPSEDPDRTEVLLVSNLRIKGEEQVQSLVMLEMLRDGAGKLIELREIERIEDDTESKVQSPLLLAFVSGFRMGEKSRRRNIQ